MPSPAVKAQLRLRASLACSAEEALGAVKRVADATNPPMRAGARVGPVLEEEDGALLLSITNLRDVSVCEFPARAQLDGDHTVLVVGGLAYYRTTQDRLFGFIPFGPTLVGGYGLYEKMLAAIAEELRGMEPEAAISVGFPV